jgi:hypothetical protein
MADCQAHAHAAGLGGEKRKKHVLSSLLCDAMAVVDDINANVMGSCNIAMQFQSPMFGIAVMHRIDSITQQIQQYLLDLHLVGNNLWQIG